MISPKDARYRKRFYREELQSKGLVSFSVMVGETDLLILARDNLYDVALETVRQVRSEIEEYIGRFPKFLSSLEPLNPDPDAAPVIVAMCETGKKVGVGPMAAVAGAVSQRVGEKLVEFSEEVIIENGGDLFLKITEERTVGCYAGEESPFRSRIGLKILPEHTPIGICTSSGVIGHSLSFGKADAAVAIAPNPVLADAAATALGNRLLRPGDVQSALDWSRGIDGLVGAVAMIGDTLGAWGSLELVRT